jgi:hypothetical protein
MGHYMAACNRIDSLYLIETAHSIPLTTWEMYMPPDIYIIFRTAMITNCKYDSAGSSMDECIEEYLQMIAMSC